MKAVSQSSSPLLHRLLFGPITPGRVLGKHHLQFHDYVVSLTPPGAPRMPNGIECAVEAGPGDRVAIGGGRLTVSGLAVLPGVEWNPVPSFAKDHVLPAGPAPLVALLAGSGPGLTPAGDDVLAGYIAGLVLLHGRRKKAAAMAEEAAERTNALSATLLRHAALGEVPEVVHTLLETGDTRGLLSFGHTSGPAWLRGLVSAGYAVDVERSLPAGRVAAGDR